MIKAKPVIQRTLTGEFIAWYRSLSRAEAKTRIPKAEITAVLKNDKPFDKKGNTWIYLTDETKHLIPEKK